MGGVIDDNISANNSAYPGTSGEIAIVNTGGKTDTTGVSNLNPGYPYKESLSDYNLFQPRGIFWNVYGYSSYQTLANWQTSTGQDGPSKVGDPLFVNPTTGNFALKSGSPAIGMGWNGLTVGSSVTQVLV